MPTLNSLSGPFKQSGKLTIASFVLLAICLFGRLAEAEYGGGSEIIASAETSTYVFLSEQSKVVKTGGIAGVHETYPIEGQFRLTVDFDAGMALFSQVDANLIDESGLLYERSLGVIFNMAELLGTVVDDTTIEFVGKTADGMESDILLTLTFRGDSVHLTGRTVPPPNSADFFIYELDAFASKKYGGGTGEANGPYLIYTAEQMNAIGAEPNDWDKHFKLMADVDLSGYTGKDFNIIGTSYDNPFTGVFDGNGHTISNFTYASTDTFSIGLFGYVDDPNAQIKNLVLIDPNIDAGTAWGVGSLVGYLDDGTVSNCYVEGGSVSGGEDVGGLVGCNHGTITRCYTTGSVMGTISSVGGLVGTNGGTIIHCYATGSVTGTTNVSGLVGRNEHGEVTDSFWDIQTSGQTTSAGGIGKTTTEMQTAGTFLDAGWDFVGESANGTEDIWSICEGTNYPRLVWQIPAGDFVCPDGITIEDFLFFIEHWRDDNCDLSNDYCDGTDLDFSGTVDINDLEIFLENWLAAGND
ncbi:MAG: GLUG motif-containing protein [Planctomycetota bacterium]